MLLLAAGCERKAPEQPSAPATAAPAEPAEPAPGPTVPGSPRALASEAPAKLDAASLNERKDPDRLLHYYAAALHARDWAAAAKAWGQGSGVTTTTLKASYDRADAPVLEIGKGDEEGAAGSLYYEAPVTLRFGTGLPERGRLVLRRVNDVDGATAEQLRWHIERSTIGQGQ
ncbi:MAG: hypothetical protein JF595_05775 [Sphingomonadales bacterium]|nr:hypothetical protein [Sphingomonadales bacterium]